MRRGRALRPSEASAPATAPGTATGGRAPRLAPAAALEMWGGIECSHVRIQGTDRDQCAESGHWDRPGDLDLIAGLRLAKIRYPMLWARAARDDGKVDFAADAARFERLRALGQVPIAGFLHHGWGPGGLDPLDPEFVPAFAAFAGAAAQRFDWIEDFTPINEPVTTARFAYLYGHWHPHLRDEAAFLRAVAALAVAVSAAMAAIRRHIPRARLIQTEDIGRTFSTPRLAHQAEYENERRFLGLDLATGAVDRAHPFWSRLIAAGVNMWTLDALRDAPCPPEVVGLDHYLTSDRFLDDTPERHPGAPVGGNGRDVYVDVAAVHAPDLQDEVGSLPRLRELHARYGLPMAITEVHNGCTREEQLRWLLEAWNAAHAARKEGAQVLAVTSWALLGSRDWNSLMTARTGHYESGAFDSRCAPPRRTAVGRAVLALARDGAYAHPLVEVSGWWRAGGDQVAGLPHLALSEAGTADAARLAACCRARGIPLASGARQSAAVVGEIRVLRDAAGGLAFLYVRRDNAACGLRVCALPGADFDHAANAFLDLSIDGETGVYWLQGLGPDNQFIARRAPETEATTGGARKAVRPGIGC